MKPQPLNSIDRNLVIQRLEILAQARALLKQEFIGIDRVIDELIDSISAWYTLPELQNRPLVVNLWGMTGTGKTSLIRRLSELIEYTKGSYVLDLGNSNESDSFFGTMDLILKHNNGRPFILMLDEFQHARTLKQGGEERAFGRMGMIWKMLDTGILDVFQYKGHQLDIVKRNVQRLSVCISKEVVVENGLVIKGAEQYSSIMGYTDELTRDKVTGIPKLRLRKKVGLNPMFYPEDDLSDLCELIPSRFQSDTMLKEHMLTLNGLETMAFLQEAMDAGRQPKICDCSKALVIVAGNLDEAYMMSSDMNPDIPAEVWKKLVKDIGINEVKAALSLRFRAEHIGRLGNNHIIYPAIGDREFKAFIQLSLRKIESNFLASHEIRLSFTPTINTIIYREGVFPTQGFRPVISTIDQMVRSKLSIIVGQVIVSYPTANEVQVSFSGKKLRVKFMVDGVSIGEEYQSLKLCLSERRKLKKDDTHALIAVHEAAHVVCLALLLNEVPEIAVSATSTSNENGFVIRSGEDKLIQRNQLLRIAASMLAGYASEKMVFGEEALTNGSSKDINGATAFVRSVLQNSGLGSSPTSIQSQKGPDFYTVIDYKGDFEKLTISYIKEAEEMARQVLEEERHLLLILAEGLFNRGSLTKAEMQRMVDVHAVRKAQERSVTPQYRKKFQQELAVLNSLQKVA